MKFFLIVSFLMSSATIDRPMFIFKNPTFETQKECQEYVNEMHMQIYQKAAASYNYRLTPEAIYCINRDAVKDIFEYNYGTEEDNKTGV